MAAELADWAQTLVVLFAEIVCGAVLAATLNTLVDVYAPPSILNTYPAEASGEVTVILPVLIKQVG